MAEFIHSVLAQNETVTAATTISYDLPVNPLSFILCTLRYQQNSADTQVAQDSVVAMISKLEVLFRGSPILSLSGADIVAMQAMLLGYVPW
ncbi:hypothetical protein KAR91_03335, partial [Candidatus Pacearchaeota archaeon]|nr:hypothetical protein [Candidatus Pacearchaeota archaeon]